jgi:dCMP deaminase
MSTDKQRKYDLMYMDIARRMSEMSFARRKKVGCVCVKDDRIISHGWNGTPTGFDNNCELEIWQDDAGYEWQNLLLDWKQIDVDTWQMPRGLLVRRKLKTKVECLHAESNTLLKLAKHGDSGKDSTLYTLLAPCIECAKLIIQAGIKRVVYSEIYPVDQFSRQGGLDLLAKANIWVEQLDMATSGCHDNDNHDRELEATESIAPDDSFGH